MRGGRRCYGRGGAGGGGEKIMSHRCNGFAIRVVLGLGDGAGGGEGRRVGGG